MRKIINWVNPKNWFYFCKGYLKKFLFAGKNEEIIYVANRAALCKECWTSEDGCCLDCGCSTYEMFLSKKPCKNFKNV